MLRGAVPLAHVPYSWQRADVPLVYVCTAGIAAPCRWRMYVQLAARCRAVGACTYSWQRAAVPLACVRTADCAAPCHRH
eukprot:2574380-Pyramimonas_sp.AAC.1